MLRDEHREPVEREPRAPVPPEGEPDPDVPVERPGPGVEHKPEPDAENIVPAKHEPGTF
jgi:hypothetical protein